MPRTYYVYLLASYHNILYVGVTNSLERRVLEHKQGDTPGFTQKYRVKKLLYFETFSDITDAIAREKQIKGYRREKKAALIK